MLKFTVEHIITLDPKAEALLSKLMGSAIGPSSNPATAAAPATEAPAKRKTAKTEEAPKATKALDFTDLPDEAKLEAIKSEVSKNTKLQKSDDIRALLKVFGAPKASALGVDQYDDFYEAICRYSKGESLDTIIEGIIGGNDDLD